MNSFLSAYSFIYAQSASSTVKVVTRTTGARWKAPEVPEPSVAVVPVFVPDPTACAVCTEVKYREKVQERKREREPVSKIE